MLGVTCIGVSNNDLAIDIAGILPQILEARRNRTGVDGFIIHDNYSANELGATFKDERWQGSRRGRGLYTPSDQIGTLPAIFLGMTSPVQPL